MLVLELALVPVLASELAFVSVLSARARDSTSCAASSCLKQIEGHKSGLIGGLEDLHMLEGWACQIH